MASTSIHRSKPGCYRSTSAGTGTPIRIARHTSKGILHLAADAVLRSSGLCTRAAGRDELREHATNDPSPDHHGPALDYVARYPPPVEDDPASPSFATDAAAAAALAGPDLHAALDLELEVEMDGLNGVGRSRRRLTLLERLRQRALDGSSDDEPRPVGNKKGEEWRSMDIPALLMSPHHAAALHSLSSSDDDTTGVPDFADLTRAHEAELVARATAEAVPPEMRPLARAASLLGYLQSQGQAQAGRAVAGRDPAGTVREGGQQQQQQGVLGSRFDSLPPEPLTAEQLERAAALLLLNNISPAAGLPVAHKRAPSDDPATPSDVAEDDCYAGAGASGCAGSATSTSAASEDEDLDILTGAAASDTQPVMAAVAAEEGVDWLSSPPPAAPSDAADTTTRGAVVTTTTTTTAAAATAAVAAVATTAAATAAAVAAAVHAPQPAAAASRAPCDEDRSVQLRRRPRKVATAAAMDPAMRRRMAAAVAQDAREADAHLVRRQDGGGAGTAAATGAAGAGGEAAAAAGTNLATAAGEFVSVTSAAAVLGGGVTHEAEALVHGVAAAGGHAVADSAAAALSAEARQAVWGEGGWPYAGGLCSADLEEGIKVAIHDQQDEAERGAPTILLP